jgi:hypothetical protein
VCSKDPDVSDVVTQNPHFAISGTRGPTYTTYSSIPYSHRIQIFQKGNVGEHIDCHPRYIAPVNCLSRLL